MMISYVRMICPGEQFSRYTQRCSYNVQMYRWVRWSDPESRSVSQDWFRTCFVSYRSGELGVLRGNQEVHQPRILGEIHFHKHQHQLWILLKPVKYWQVQVNHVFTLTPIKMGSVILCRNIGQLRFHIGYMILFWSFYASLSFWHRWHSFPFSELNSDSKSERDKETTLENSPDHFLGLKFWVRWM